MDTSDTSHSLPSPRHLAGVEQSTLTISDSPTLLVRSQRQQVDLECSSPLFLGDRTSPSPAPTPARPRSRRVRLTAEERARKHAERVKELADRQRWREANRIRQRRSDTMQDLIIRFDAELAQDALASVMTPLREKLESDGATIQIEPPSLVRSAKRFGMIVFERRVRSEYDPIQKLWAPLDEEQILRESTCLHIATSTALLQSINENKLADHIMNATPPALGTDVQVDEPARHVLVILGLDTHLQQQRNAKNRAYAEGVRHRMQSGQGAVTLRLPNEEDLRPKIEHALLQLQMLNNCHVVRVPQLNDAVNWLYSIACDVSIRPYKVLETARHFPVRASRTITGHTDLATFQGMLEQIPRCNAPAIYAITEKYPTFRSLMEAFEKTTPEKGATLLADLEVRMVSNAVSKWSE